MADVWKIAEYVESHPENHEQRWRLSKKLYLAWEYRLALEHLLILKNDWKQKLSVVRYLAATYFRLNRYPEAVEELETAIDTWPDNIDLREQLAHTFQEADRKLDASEAWQTVADMRPDHPFAQKVSDKLRKEVLGDDSPAPSKSAAKRTSKKGDVRTSSPRAHIAGAELICSNCGARNGPEFERCWQCHGSLANAFEAPPNVDDTPVATRVRAQSPNPFPWSLAGALAIVALLTVGVYLTLRYYFPPEGAETLSASVSVYAFLVQTFSVTRILVGVVLMIAWPIIFYLSTNMLGTEEDLVQEVVVAGLFLASLFYVLTWLPLDLINLVLIVPILASLVIVAILFRKHPARAAGIFFLQLAMVSIVVVTVAAARHGIGAVTDSRRIIAYAKERTAEAPLKTSKTTPLRFVATWKSTGSKWLDEMATTAAFTVTPGQFEGTLILEVEDGAKRLEYRKIERPSTSFEIVGVIPDRPYAIVVNGPDDVGVSITIESLMDVVLERVAIAPESS